MPSAAKAAGAIVKLVKMAHNVENAGPLKLKVGIGASRAVRWVLGPAAAIITPLLRALKGPDKLHVLNVHGSWPSGAQRGA